MATRRKFLAGVGALATVPSISWSAVGHPVAVSGARLPDGTDALVGIDAHGSLTFQLPLTARAHAGAAHPTKAEAVVIARRPGTFAKVLDCGTGQILHSLTAPKDRHFYGHAAFSSDGTLLFTTENEMATGAGRIGVWDRSSGYLRIDEIASGGIGPHEILRLPSGDLAVANGGIRTHPDSGREKLNLDTMRPNLTILSPSGTIADQAEPPTDQHQNSLRHIAAAPDGTVICGFQWQGDPFDAPPLISLWRAGQGLVAASITPETNRMLKGYIGSVSALGATGFAASAPRGARVITFDTEGLETNRDCAEDVCGLAMGAIPIVSDGMGRIHTLRNARLHTLATHQLAFDNHLVPIL
ncbi:DUF1513 domain-containing protein [Marivita sp. S0852]|uniref:DUF1513 domain-containing protein n=1 Tax=Marivita sp. S0852 TaxID=3373893 RepID=UPI0039822ADE